jgi:PAS domain S-box-containing protein
MKDAVPRKGANPMRRRAEQLVRARKSGTVSMGEEAVRALVHELQVHQIELELQNEELREAQLELAFTRDRYADLYEFAPIGYVTLDRKGRITESNFAVATLLGMDRAELAGAAISRFVAPESRDDCHFHLRAVFESDTKQIHELGMLRKDGFRLVVRLESLVIEPPVEKARLEKARYCRTAIIDITEARLARKKLQQLNQELEERVQARTRDLRIMSSEMMLTEARERQRLAEDLHDSFGQALFRARMLLDRGRLNDQAAADLRTILEEVSQTVNTLTYELSPLVLRAMGLWNALGQLAKNLRQRYGLSVRIARHDPGVPLDDNIGIVLFRSIRELLINVAKHAGTNFASLSVRESDACVSVVVKDLGKGFDVNDQSHSVQEGHFGLFSVRERLEYLGGAFKIKSARGAGTTVTLTVPRKQPEAQALKSSDRPV